MVDPRSLSDADLDDLAARVEREQARRSHGYAIKFDMQRAKRRWTALGPDGLIGHFDTPEDAMRALPTGAVASLHFVDNPKRRPHAGQGPVLGNRAKVALEHLRVESPADLARVTQSQLERIKHVGPKTIREIRAWGAYYGVSLID